ncbi:MAG: ABC transporter permease [Anaerolineae bacterium]
MTKNRREQLTLTFLRYTTPIMFVLIFLFFGVQSPRFLEIENISNIIKQASFIGIVAVGMTFVLLTAGIDISVGSSMYLAPLIAGLLMRNQGFDVLPALAVALLAGGVMGLMNGFFVVQLKISPFLVTLATLFFFRGAGTFLTSSRSLDFPRDLIDFGLINVVGIPLPIIVFLSLTLLAHLVLTRTAYGRQIYAIGHDIEAAKKAGIKTQRIIMSVYVISGVCAALGGFILISQIGRLDQSFGEEAEFQVIAAAVLGGASLFGGVGTAFGPLIGATLVQMVQAGLVFTNVNLYLQPMVEGTIIFLAVFFDSLRTSNIKRLKRRFIRAEA